MKRYLRIVLLGLGCFALALLLRTPAEFAYHYLGNRLPGQLFDISGTVVKGQARGLAGNRILLENVRWSLRPGALFKGRLEYGTKLTVGDGNLRARTALAWDGAYHLTEVEGNVALAPLLPAIVPIAGGIDGRLSPDLELLRIDDGVLQAVRGQIRVNYLVLLQSPLVMLGNFVAEPEGDGPPWQLAVRDDGGPLRLTGRVSLSGAGSFEFDGLAGARDEQGPVSGILNALGVADQEGQRRIQFTGTL
jgi:hypothetical protein